MADIQLEPCKTYEWIRGSRVWRIPERTFEALKQYIDSHRPVGDFLTAVLENDLSKAIGYADNENLDNLPAIAGYLFNVAPHSCWGSKVKVTAWLKQKPVREF